MAIRVVTFDVDGTLMRRYEGVSTLKVEAIDYAVRKVFALKAFNYLDHLMPRMYGMTDRSIFRLLLKNLGIVSDNVDRLVDKMLAEALAYFDSHPEHTVDKDYYLLPGVKSMLGALHDDGVKMGLATGNYSNFALWKVDGLGIGDYFTFGAYGEDAEDRAEIIKIALNRAQNDGLPACHFGDTPVDIKSAHANKVFGCAISSKGGATFETQALYDADADLVIDSWSDVHRVMNFLAEN
jgi:phosphoglycolate phosphatase